MDQDVTVRSSGKGAARGQSLTRRAALGVLAAGAVGYAALGPQRERDPLAKGRVRLTYWEKWTGHEAGAMQRVVDAFNQSQGRIYVRMLSMTLIEQKAMLAIAGGTPPDVVGLYDKSLSLFAQTGAIRPLADLAAVHGLHAGSYAQACARLCTVSPTGPGAADGTLFGLPNTCSTMALYYSRPALRSVGLDPDAPPTTIQELDDFAAKLTVENASRGGASRYERLGFVQTEPGWWPHVWGYAFGGTLYDPATDRAMTASDANRAAYRWVQETSRRLGVQEMMGFQSGLGSFSSAQQPLISGRVAMCLHGPFLVSVIRRFAPEFDFGVAPFPVSGIAVRADEPVGLVECDVLTIPANAKHPREAMEFVAFTQRRDVQEALCIEHAKPSPLASTSESYQARHPNPLIRVHEAIARSPRGFGYPATRVWNEYESLLRRRFERDIWQLGADSDLVLEEVQRDAQAALDLAAERRRLRA